MPYYDYISNQWHKATGYKGGAFKELVLNDVLLKLIPQINDCSVLELGAGNGYFLPLLLRRYSGQVPLSVVITDQSQKMIDIAKKHFFIPNAIYRVLDVRNKFPFPDNTFDLIIATMIFNEVADKDLERCLLECFRILRDKGLLLITVTHPHFINDLQKRSQLQKTNGEKLTMPGAGSLRLPVVVRSAQAYEQILTKCRYQFEETSIFPTPQVINVKPGLRNSKNIPLALVFKCKKH